jgi:hypothetical protein
LNFVQFDSAQRMRRKLIQVEARTNAVSPQGTLMRLDIALIFEGS